MNDPVSAFRTELHRAAVRRSRASRRRRRAGLVALLGVVAAACTGITVAATGVFTGSPAPPGVVAEFESYTPQLGYHPEPGRAQLVARDGADYALYATPNREGSYCIVTSAPWFKPGTHGEGGTCVSKRDAAQPIIAGITRAGSVEEDGDAILVVAGRVRVPRARAVAFTTAGGEPVTRPLGAGGFFVASVRFTICPEEPWKPTFSAVDADGEALAQSAIELVSVRNDPKIRGGRPMCGWGVAPHGPYPRR